MSSRNSAEGLVLQGLNSVVSKMGDSLRGSQRGSDKFCTPDYLKLTDGSTWVVITMSLNPRMSSKDYSE